MFWENKSMFQSLLLFFRNCVKKCPTQKSKTAALAYIDNALPIEPPGRYSDETIHQ